MKTLKTFITILVALCAIFCMFTGCESTKVSTPKVEDNEQTKDVVTPVEPEETITEEDIDVEDIVDLIPTTPETLTGGWVLYTMEDKDGEYPISTEVTMSFNFADETEIYGCAGINNYHGSIEIEGLDISFGPVAVTKMAGLPEDMETEDNFLRILGDVNKIGFYENLEGYEELILMNAKTGSVLCFIR